MRLSPEEIDRLVQRAIAGEGSLDSLVNAALFGSHRKRPRAWSEWPEDARQSWDAAFRRMSEVHPWTTDAEPHRRQNRTAVTRTQAWNAILSYASDPARWWMVPSLTWSDLTVHLGLPVRTIHYQLCDLQGWRFRGRGVRRMVVRAPCEACGETFPPSFLFGRLCSTCHSKV